MAQPQDISEAGPGLRRVMEGMGATQFIAQDDGGTLIMEDGMDTELSAAMLAIADEIVARSGTESRAVAAALLESDGPTSGVIQPEGYTWLAGEANKRKLKGVMLELTEMDLAMIATNNAVAVIRWKGDMIIITLSDCDRSKLLALMPEKEAVDGAA